MIEKLLPSPIAAVEAFADIVDEPLFPQEQAAIAQSVDKRQREFRTVRACARGALGELGLDRPPMVPGTRGAPSWPTGIVGSMTHCADYRAAAVARAGDFLSLGLDAEPDQPLPDGVLEAIARPEELNRLAALRADRSVHWDRLLFSAKESIYKAWFPLTGRFLEFEEASLTFEPVTRTFEATLLVEGPLLSGRRLTGFSGRWLTDQGLLVTAVLLPAP